MNMQPTVFILLTSVASAMIDINRNPRIFETLQLPSDRFMPSVGNGHVATVLHSVTVYMNGLYNGERGDSRPARIPSRINIRIKISDLKDNRFILDTEKGMFIEKLVSNDVHIEQITFAHRLHTPLLIVHISANFSHSASDFIAFNLTDNPGPDSSDLKFSRPKNFSRGPGKEQLGTTKIVEDAEYQPYSTPVHVIYSDVPETVTLNKTASSVTFIMAVANTYEEASEAYLYAMNLIILGKPTDILQSHISRWRDIWNAGNVYLDGPNLELAKVVAGSMYYLLSSLPYEEDNIKRKRFYGLSPGSLANGAYYQGHSFWDSETWMFPPVLLFWPHVAKDIILYRMANVEPARAFAKATGYQGIRFPWESAFTGVDVTPDCCLETRENQQHITGDISFATRQYWAATQDYSWLLGENYSFHLEINGCDMIHGMAEFWASRAEFNETLQQYEINGVMPPDEDHPHVNNSIYTNVGAAFSIFFAKHIECVCNTSMSLPVPDEWLDIARKLKVPLDEENQYHPEFDGYLIGETIKQADVVLLGYPFMYVNDPIKRKRDLEIYENSTRPNGPAMSMGMYAIGYLEVGNDARAEYLFNRSYQLYKMEPFKVWRGTLSESATVNFITGMGGFLQGLLFGYAGIRLKLDHISFNPKLPPGITNFTIHGLNYLGCSIDLSIMHEETRITWTGDPCRFLTLSTPLYEFANTVTMMSERGATHLPRQQFAIEPIHPSNCTLPEDVLGQSGTRKSSYLPNPCVSFVIAFTTFIISLFYNSLHDFY